MTRRTEVQGEKLAPPWGGRRAASTRGAWRWKEAAEGWVWPSEPVSQLCTWRVLLMNFHPHPSYQSFSYLGHLSLIAATRVKVRKSALNSSKGEHEKDVFKTEEWVEANPFCEAPKELVTRTWRSGREEPPFSRERHTQTKAHGVGLFTAFSGQYPE